MINILHCPICQSELTLVNNQKSVQCRNKHLFDFSKSGYLNLLQSQKSANQGLGDNKLMIDARRQFLNQGYYSGLVTTVINQLSTYSFNHLVDLGCGEGYYTAQLAKHFPNAHILGIDISKYAIDKAAKKDKQSLYIVASNFHLPMNNEQVDAVVAMFTNVSIFEIERILKHKGVFVHVTVGLNHLYQLKAALYDQPKLNDPVILPKNHLKLMNTFSHQEEIIVNSTQDIMNLLMMTPYFYTTSETAKEALANFSSLTVTLDFNINIYQR